MRVYDGSSTGDRDRAEPPVRKVGIAEYAVTTEGAVLTTSGLGSCIGVALYDSQAGVAGLVHVMLPTADDDARNPAKYADSGIEALVRAMEDAGASTERITAKLAGGSDMLDFSENGATIGSRNVDRAREALTARGVPVEGEDLGGDYGRSLKFRGRSGDLVVKSASRDSTTL